MIVFGMMWDFGFAELADRLKMKKRVDRQCKKFADADRFMELVFLGNEIWNEQLIHFLSRFLYLCHGGI